MRVRCIVFITALVLCHGELPSQTLTNQFPQQTSQQAPPAATPSGDADSDPALPDAPIAELVPPAPTGVPVRIEAALQEKHGSVYTLSGDVAIFYKNYTLRADKITFDQETSEATAEGHLQLDGGADDELITADHGTLNLNLETGRFYNVTGTIGVRAQPHRKLVYTNVNPFIFTGRVLIKTGVQRYTVIGGSMTSCRLPRPDWRILSSSIAVNNGVAQARNSYFKLLGMPILYLPYVTHPVSSSSRESGILIPTLGTSSTKGTVVGDSYYLVLGRSMDAVFGTEYYSKRGWSPTVQFRYRGRGEDFAYFHFVALYDRGLAPNYVNQGGEDYVLNGRRDFDLDEHMRAVATAEYLSSYVYRLAFAESFSQAVASQVKSSGFITHNNHGWSQSLRLDRYQNFESSNPGDEIRILHLPSFDVDVTDHRLGPLPAVWGFDGSIAGLSRSEPAFRTSREVSRVDAYPRLSLPLVFGGWTLRPEVAARQTFYSKSQNPTSTVPFERDATVERKDVEASFELRPPVLVREFQAPWLERLLGGQLRHTIEPMLQYRYVAGIGNFNSILRFDTTDVASDTNELEATLVQRFFVKRSSNQGPCVSGELPPPSAGQISIPPGYTECGAETDDWVTWRVAAKYFFDPTFGGAVTPFRRNVLTPTLEFTGVSFLGGPRDYSPVLSRLNLRTTAHTDLEWDVDYDSKAGGISASNVFADYRYGNMAASVGHSRLEALNPSFTSASARATNYNDLRWTVAYGQPTRRGLSAAADAGYDFDVNALQYGGVQTSYNWDCCGLNIEYRRLALGSVRNENQYRFNFTLAGVGTAGNLNRAERIF